MVTKRYCSYPPSPILLFYNSLYTMKAKYYFSFASPFVLNKLKALSQTNNFHHTVKKIVETTNLKNCPLLLYFSLTREMMWGSEEWSRSCSQWFVVKRQSLGGINQRPKDKRHPKTKATPVSHFTQKIRETTCAYHRIIVMTNTTTDWSYSNWKIMASGHKLPRTVGE